MPYLSESVKNKGEASRNELASKIISDLILKIHPD